MFIVSFERTFKIIYKILLQIFHILLDSSNILTESNKLFAILDYWGYMHRKLFYPGIASDQYAPKTFWLLFQISNCYSAT
jgi:hypothetical protein